MEPNSLQSEISTSDPPSSSIDQSSDNSSSPVTSRVELSSTSSSSVSNYDLKSQIESNNGDDARHNHHLKSPISQTNLTRSLSSTSTKSISSISTVCDSCVDPAPVPDVDFGQPNPVQAVVESSKFTNHINSLVICNFNAAKKGQIDSECDDDTDVDEDELDDEEDDEQEEEDDDDNVIDDDIDMLSYRSSGFSGSALASDVLLAYEDEPNIEDSVGLKFSCITTTSSSTQQQQQRRHVLFMETHAIGKPALDLYPEYYPLIIEKICAKDDVHQLNKYLFLLDQFVRLCNIMQSYSDEPNIRRCSYFPFLFPNLLPPRPLPSRRNRFLRKVYPNQKFPFHGNFSLMSTNARMSKCGTSYPTSGTKPVLSYLDRPFVDTYLELIEAFVAANSAIITEGPNNVTCDKIVQKQKCSLKLSHFCLKLFSQFPELIRSDLLEGTRANSPLFDLVDPFALYEPMDNYRFVAYVRTHFHSLEEDVEVLAQMDHLNPERIEHLFGSLYHRYNLIELFKLYHSLARHVRSIFCKAVLRRYPESRNLTTEQKEELLNKIFEVNFRHRKSPLLDILHDLTTHTSDNSTEFDYHQSLTVFCYRATLYRHAHCLATSLDRSFIEGDQIIPNADSMSHSYHQHPVRHIGEPLCTSLVGHLYKVTIQLTLLATVYSGEDANHFMERLLRIKVHDFDFKHFLQQSLDILENELNSINFDLQNRHHDNNPLLIDSDDMDDDEFEHLPQESLESSTIGPDGSHHHHHHHHQAGHSAFYPWSLSSSATSSMSSLNSVEGSSSVGSGSLESVASSATSGSSRSRPTSTSPPLLMSSSSSSHRVISSPPSLFDLNNNSTEHPLLDALVHARTTSASTTGTTRNHHHHHHHHRGSHNAVIEIPTNLYDKRALLDKIKSQGMLLLAPPNNRWSFEECSVCCVTQWLLVRSCCGFSACLDCLSRYYTDRIEMGNLSIECIGTECRELVYRAEVNARLSPDKKALYNRMLLLQSSESDRSKPCPQCNTILTLTPDKEREMKQANNRLFYGTKQLLMSTLGLKKKKSKSKQQQGEIELEQINNNTTTTKRKSHSPMASFVSDSLVFKVECDRCKFYWCFKCHSPWHEGLSCKQFMKGDTLLKSWAKNVDFNGQVNAQKCPKCKIYIQRTSGCDHMLCTRCKTDFCYKCGDQLRQVKFFGDHYSRLSVLGCKYRYKPDKPFQRRLIRGTVFGSKLMLLPVLSSVCLCAGAVVLALGIAALPLFGGVRVYRRLRRNSSNHRRNGRSNINVIRAHTEARNRLAAINGNAHNDDVWNRTVQMYSNRLRNNRPAVPLNLVNNNNTTNNNPNPNNNMATQTTPPTPLTSTRFPWFDSSLMLNNELDYVDHSHPNVHHHLPFHYAHHHLQHYNHDGDDHHHHHHHHPGVPEVFYIPELSEEDNELHRQYHHEQMHNILLGEQTAAMKLYSSHSGRNPVVLKFTEQDLTEIIDDNYNSNNVNQQQEGSKHRHSKHRSNKSNNKSKSTKSTKHTKNVNEDVTNEVKIVEIVDNDNSTKGEIDRGNGDVNVSSAPVVTTPSIERKCTMEKLVRKLTINQSMMC